MRWFRATERSFQDFFLHNNTVNYKNNFTPNSVDLSVTFQLLKGDSNPNGMFYQKELYEPWFWYKYHQNLLKNGEVVDI